LYRHPSVRDRTQEAWTLAALAFALESQGRFADALKHYAEALQIAEERKERPLAANILRSMGWLYRTLGQPEQALTRQQRSLALAKEVQNEVMIADALYALAALHSDFGDAKQAFVLVEQARETYRAQKNDFGLMSAENATGVYFYRQGDIVSARGCFE